MVLPIWPLPSRIASLCKPAYLSRSLAMVSMTSSGLATSEQSPASKSCIVYTAVESPSHRLAGHVEAPERVSSALTSLAAASLIGPKAKAAYTDRVRLLQSPRLAGIEDVSLVHGYAKSLGSKCSVAKPSAPVVVADLGDPVGFYSLLPKWFAPQPFIPFIYITSCSQFGLYFGAGWRYIRHTVFISGRPGRPGSFFEYC